MVIEDILKQLSELETDHYLIIVDEDGEPNIFRPVNQSTESSLELLAIAAECEIEISSEIHTIESIQ